MKGLSIIFTVIVAAVVILVLGLILMALMGSLPLVTKPAATEGMYATALEKCRNVAISECKPNSAVNMQYIVMTGGLEGPCYPNVAGVGNYYLCDKNEYISDKSTACTVTTTSGTAPNIVTTTKPGPCTEAGPQAGSERTINIVPIS